MFCYLWEYRVEARRIQEFRETYGPEGDWALLFRRDSAYLCTELLQDADHPARFVTIDYWADRESCLAFRRRFRDEFDALDARCGGLTEGETHLGDFDVAGDAR